MSSAPEGSQIIEDEDKAVKAKRMQEQCFLIYNFEGFAGSNRSKTYKHFVPIGGSPTEIVQKLLAIPNLHGLMSIPPYLLSSLVPQIRIYKVHYPSENSEGETVEMPFEDFLNTAMLDKMTMSGQDRGMGVGLKSFEWELLGTNPAESDNNIKAKLKLHFNTLHDFVIPRGKAENGDEISYMNLIVPVRKFNIDTSNQCGDNQGEGERSYNNKYFRLKCSVGYGTPTGSVWEDAAQGGPLLKAIDNARQFFYLTLISHSLDFKEDGSLDLEIEYVAAMEGALVHPKADVLLSGVNNEQMSSINQRATERASERKRHADSVSAENDRNCGKDEDDRETEAREEQEESEEELKQGEAEDRAILYNGILTALEESNSIYAIKLKEEDLGELEGEQQNFSGATSQPPRTVWSADKVTTERGDPVRGSTSDLSSAVGEAVDDAAEAAGSFTQDGAEPNESKVHYFHFGDLIDVALNCLYRTSAPDVLSELKVITGPFVYFNPRTGKLTDEFGMCDIPISMNLFQIWFMDYVVKPQRTTYKLKQFIKDAVTSLIGAAMKPECFGKDYGSAPAKLSLQLIEAPATNDGKCRITGTDPSGAIGGKRANFSDILPYPDAVSMETAKAFSYLFMYVSSSGAKGFGPPQDGEGTREERDAKLGTYHLRIGSDTGLMKKAKFKKSDQPYAREARMEKAGDLDGDSLREKYDADVEMFGNAIFKPGTHVYIDPTTVGAGNPQDVATIARRMGLGGYFMVTNVKSSIESGKFTTDLKCIWTASGTGNVPEDACSNDNDCQAGGTSSSGPSGAGAPSGSTGSV